MVPQSLDRRVREAAYRDVEALLASRPDAIGFRHQRACLLGLLGRRDEAQAEFIDLLAREPKNFGILNDFGMFLFAGGLRKAASVALQEAVRWHPDDSVGRTNLASLYLTDGEIEKAREHFERAVTLDPANAKAREGLSLLLARAGDEAGARRERPVIVRKASAIAPFAHDGDPIRVLLVESVIGGNIYAREFLDDPAFDVRQVFAEFLADDVPLPEHDVVWNAIGDAERCGHLLQIAPEILARTTAPVLCHPRTLLATRRVDIAQRLAGLAGVRTPRTIEIARAGAREKSVAELGYPLLLRSPGFHTGEHFVRIERPQDFTEAATALPGDKLTAIEFVDARSRDGKVRKYRAIVVGGRLFPLHLAVSEYWKVHYFTADMSENEANREEDAAYLRDPEGAIGSRAMQALGSVAQTLRLDYGGIDFGFDASGKLVVFEANATMIVPEPDDDDRWRYRRAPVQHIYDAVREMVATSARSSGGARSDPQR